MQQNETTPSGTIKLDELLTQKFDAKLHPEFTTDEVVVLPYSSGTTGVSKGVQLTNRNIVSNLHQFNADGMRFVSEAYGTFAKRSGTVDLLNFTSVQISFCCTYLGCFGLQVRSVRLVLANRKEVLWHLVSEEENLSEER